VECELNLEPNPERAAAIDSNVRARLIESLEYLDGFLARNLVPVGLASVVARVRDGPVSPFVFCLSSDLVATLSRGDFESARQTAESMCLAAAEPAFPGIVSYLDTALPNRWWETFHALLDTDPDRDFRPSAPSREGLLAFAEQYNEALQIMAYCDPQLAKEFSSLVRMVVPAAPSLRSDDQYFNGASTFLAWGATVLNAEISRHPITMIDVLVHESGHLLLFGLVEGGALTSNQPEERYQSPLRRDTRPIDGIFHACFVSTRVNIAMSRLIANGRLKARSKEIACERMQHNGDSAIRCLEMLNRHAQPTRNGSAVLKILNAYWFNEGTG
jgi:HEXXH motif-containing protein